MKLNGLDGLRKFKIWTYPAALIAIAIILTLLPTQFLGLALGCLMEITSLGVLWLLVRRCRSFAWLNNTYMSIALAVVTMGVMHEWEKRVFRSHAEKIAERVLCGRDSVELLENSPWVLRLYCFGRMDWFRNEIVSMADDWLSLNNAVRCRDEVLANDELKSICDRYDSLKNVCKYGLPGKIAYWVAEKIRLRGLLHVGGISEGVSRRAQILSQIVSEKDLSCSGNSLLVDVSLYANSEEYVTELCARGRCGNVVDVGLMKNEWSFAVGVPNDAPETFPVMISSNLDPARLPRVNHGGTNFCGYVEAGCFARCGSGSVVVVTKSGVVRVLDSCHLNDSDGSLTFSFDLREVIGAEAYQLNEGTYYLTPIGKVFPLARQ